MNEETVTGKPRPRVGRPAELDAPRIVATAIALADEAGLGAASLTKVAAALDVTPMSLYRHIGSKGGLTDLMVDTAFGPPPTIAGDWRPALREWANGQRTVFARHPWITRIPVTGPPRGSNALAWMNAGLAALRDTGLDWRAKIGAITVVGGYVRQAFVTDRSIAERRGADQRSEAQDLDAYQRDVSAVDLSGLPEIAALFTAQAFADIPPDDESADDDFTFGLELILDGIAAAIARSS
ncbi:TetR/AcrR family transcriptional regulator [Nocardia rosealba]|uniref:TetR/AcrR family transcriptional regulator n=1 Tax=Nocardia rosealba TaxID=2878563 RepID=UPI001CDA30B1|nr:TetR/AcrR family transcriptional regulator [Nocardia rosealba]MCA2206662.1 TetR/AcrR family transcriptional regulator [Nocardia rosealba]